MRHGRLLAVALVAALGVAGVACGDDDDPTGAPSTTSATTSTTAPSTVEVFLQPADIGDDCTEVVGVEREAGPDAGIEEAVEQLLAGPTPAEEARGLTSWFSSETAGMLRAVEVADGVAEVDFEDFAPVIPNASTSCGSAGLLAQLDRTVLQFGGVERAVYAFDGDPERFYGWLQLESPVATCEAFGDAGDVSGPAAVSREPAVALLRNVQVQASSCVDEVAFSFMGGLPGWSAGYAEGPLTEDPSGAPVALAGEASLVVRFEPAAGVDLAQEQPIETYDGPTAMSPPDPAAVAGLRRLGDFEAVTSWAIGLPDERPFEVVARGEQLVVRVAAPATRPTRCSLAGTDVTVAYPDDWYVELSDRWACRYLDPEPFVVHPATDDVGWAVTVDVADVDAEGVLARLSSGARVSEGTTVAGMPATVVDVVEDGTGLHPEGFTSRTYVVDAGARAVTITSAAAPPGPGLDARLAAVDRIASMLER